MNYRDSVVIGIVGGYIISTSIIGTTWLIGAIVKMVGVLVTGGAN